MRVSAWLNNYQPSKWNKWIWKVECASTDYIIWLIYNLWKEKKIAIFLFTNYQIASLWYIKNNFTKLLFYHTLI